MADKHTKNWLIAFVLALSVTGGFASYLSQENVFFIGTEKQNLLASVLGGAGVDETRRHAELVSASPSSSEFTDSEIAAANASRLESAAKELGVKTETVPESDQLPSKPKLEPVTSPCSPEEITVFKDGRFSECRRKNVILNSPVILNSFQDPNEMLNKPALAQARVQQDTKNKVPLAPAPKIKVQGSGIRDQGSVNSTYAASCETQSLFNYTGPDREGLLYGMCIKCPTEEYVFNNGKCK